MPNHDAAPEPDPGRRMSRRSLLQGAATAGAAGLAATAMGAAVSQAATRPDLAHSHGPGQPPAGPIMVHVRDARSGDIELFAGTSQTRVHDKDLAARITRALTRRGN
jgi:phosphodiesterase/alkaline phosphatase D-like protein